MWAALPSGSRPGIAAVAADGELLLWTASAAPAWPLVPFFAWDQKHDNFRKKTAMMMPYFERISTQNSDFHCLAKGGTLWLRSQMVLILPPWSQTVAIELLLGISSCGATALRVLLRLVDPAVEA